MGHLKRSRGEIEAGLEQFSGADVELEMESWDVGGDEESLAGVVRAQEEVMEPKVIEYLPWGQVQEEMLDAILLDSAESEEEEVWDGDNLKALAKRLRSSVEELKEFRELTSDESWIRHRFERLLELEKLAKRGISWDRLENAALQKLMTLVFEGKIVKAGELLQVARVANVATRRPIDPSTVQPNQPGGFNVQVNMFGQPVVGGGGLPGPGNIGTLRLNLSQRTVQQLSQGKTIDGESQRLSDTIEMLGSDDIKELTELAEDGNE